MENVWTLAALWVGLALVATLLAIWFKISTALTEIVVGTVAQLVIGAFVLGCENGMDHILSRNRGDRAHVSCRRRARPDNLSHLRLRGY